MHRIAFANALRGIACISVVICHYVVVFNMIKGAYGGIPELPETPYPELLTDILNPFPQINLGPFGVSLFFLISGLVIPISVQNFSNEENGRIKFIIARFFRIWPTYMLGFVISLLALNIAASYMGNTTPYTIPQILTNLTLFRDWFGGFQQIDGVVWTLEVEIKFYLAILLFWKMIARGSLLPILIIAACMIGAAPLKPLTTWPANFPENQVYCLKYIFFMMIGVVFSYHNRGLIKTKKLTTIVISMLTLFIATTIFEGWQSDFIAGYAASFIVFFSMYFLARDWEGNLVIKHLAKISYPLYACHAMFGAVSIRLMIDTGVPATVALAVQILLVIAVATAMHNYLERPSQAIGKIISSKITFRQKINREI